jgi:hypothetical protein
VGRNERDTHGAIRIFARRNYIKPRETFIEGRSEPAISDYETGFPFHNRSTVIYITACTISLKLFETVGAFRKSFNRLGFAAFVLQCLNINL